MLKKTVLALLILAILAAGLVVWTRKYNHKPNVIVLLLDTTRADHLGVYGYERDTSPVLDQFARENLRAEYAITAAPWTPPSVASILSGLYVSTHGLMPPNSREEAKNVTARLNPEVVTLGEVLAANGYATAGISSNPWISEEFGFNQGFETFRHIPRARASEVTTAAMKLSEELSKGDKPFFLYVHYLDPHDPYDPPDKYRSLFSGPLKSRPGYSEKMLENIGLYDGEIRYLDTAIGKLFDSLKAQGLYDDSVIVVVGDHGEQFMERGNLTHGFQLFNEEVRVPLLVKAGSNGPKGKTIDVSVSTVDIFPTILSTARVPVPERHAGISLLDEQALSKRAGVLSEITRKYQQRSFTSFDGRKLIIGSKSENEMVPADDPSTNIIGVFDRRTDPFETKSVDDPDSLAELQMEFRSVLSTARSQHVTAKGKEGEVSDTTLEQLKSLGYLQ